MLCSREDLFFPTLLLTDLPIPSLKSCKLAKKLPHFMGFLSQIFSVPVFAASYRPK